MSPQCIARFILCHLVRSPLCRTLDPRPQLPSALIRPTIDGGFPRLRRHLSHRSGESEIGVYLVRSEEAGPPLEAACWNNRHSSISRQYALALCLQVLMNRSKP